MDSLKQRTAKSLAWGMLNNGSMQLLNIVIGIFLARLLSPTDYGIVGVLAIFTSIAGNLQSCGFSQALTNMKEPQRKDYNAVFWFNILVSIVIYAILFISAPLIAKYFRQDELINLSRVVFLSFVISALGITPGAYMFKKLMVRETTIIGVTALIISGIIGIILAWNGMGYWSLAFQQIIYVSIITIGRYFYASFRPSFKIDFSPIKGMFNFSVKILLTTIINSLGLNVLTFIFGRIFPMRIVGNFSQANKWNLMAYSFLTGTISQVAQPVLVEVGDDKEREKRVLHKMMRFTSMLTFPAMLGLAMVADEFIRIAISDKWASCVPLLQLLCIGGAFMPFHTLFQNLAISKGRSDIYLTLGVLLLSLQIGITLIFSRYTINIMVGAYSLLIIIFCGLWWYVAHRLINLNIKETIKDFLPFLLSAIVTMLLTYFITKPINNLVILLLTRIILAIIIYYLVMKKFQKEILSECILYFKNRKTI